MIILYYMEELLLSNESLFEKETDNTSKYQRRPNRSYSSQRPKIENLNKVIIPYDFEQNNYCIQESEISFYEKKEYLLSQLKKWNNIDLFKVNIEYSPSFWQMLLLSIPYIIFNIFAFILSFILLSLFIFNPFLVYIDVWGFIKLYHLFKTFQYMLLEKFKQLKIQKLISRENSSEFCIQNKLEWKYGENGYWLELIKKL